MDITIYKRGKNGKKIGEKIATKSVNIKFKDRSVNIEKQIFIGRSDSNDIAIKDDPLISRKHATIEKIKDVYYISDLGSTNGTYVNKNPVQKDQKMRLKAGDVIKVGKTELVLCE